MRCTLTHTVSQGIIIFLFFKYCDSYEFPIFSTITQWLPTSRVSPICYVGVISRGYASRWRMRHSVIASVKLDGSRSQTMNTKGASASSTCPCMYIVNVLLLCTALCMRKGKKRLCQDHKISNSIALCALQHCTKRPAFTHTFDSCCFQRRRFNRGNTSMS